VVQELEKVDLEGEGEFRPLGISRFYGYISSKFLNDHFRYSEAKTHPSTVAVFRT
jgi:hypothetical protein